ncbi:putative vacuolar atp synthase 98 kda subunit protein [Zalerion maritima]|uniref:V-type proton ATPase subunit a n=1 Tax=Zalerion maritima TaxID=339359 RepID=A0AAD5RGJ9_9PEZI|nr:putative vacuolar atp synthase 98 kda subunit protein [Zalerion maritima]
MASEQETILRSADMTMVQLFTPSEQAREVVTALGEVGLVHFRDLNGNVNSFQRTYTAQLRRLDNLERQLRYFHSHMVKANVPVRKIDLDIERIASPTPLEIDDLAERSQALEARITELNESYETLKKREIEYLEWRHVLREAGRFFDRAHGNVEEIRQSMDVDDAPLLEDVEQQLQGGEAQDRSFTGMNIGFVAGVINREKMESFERILWRSLRGNLYMNQAEILEDLVDPKDNSKVQKNVFVIFANGRELLNKIRKISESMGADLYKVDENSDLRRDQIHEVNNRLNDVQNVLQNTQQTLEAELSQIAQALAGWLILVAKEKAVYDTLNNFSYDKTRRTLIAEAWVPSQDLPLIRSALNDVNMRAGHSVPSIISEVTTGKTPPTYLRTNKFTEAFQTIINAYGTCTYKEVNPALPSLVTFPFLFAVMFGDVGHAFIMLMTALALIFWENKLKKVREEIFGMIFYGRYIMFMMAAYSVFTGFIYNDIFSLPMTIFPSAWHYEPSEDYIAGHMIEAKLNTDGYRYPIGLDWNWHGTENSLVFTNSLKMKLSILIGWCHMTFSLCLMIPNARFFKKPIDLWGVFLPSMIFFQAIFGYLVIAILYKWGVNWIAEEEPAPGLLNMLIYMFLSPGTIDQPLYSGQSPVQQILVLLAVIQVPAILLAKPLFLRWEHNKARSKGYRGIGEGGVVHHAMDDVDDDEQEMLNDRQSVDTLDAAAGVQGVAGASVSGEGEGSEHEEFDFGEMMIHQAIHTIEFCLNCISHTASYLRLWALSLAHQQLSIVLWSMTLGSTLNGSGTGSPIVNGIIIFVMAGFWLGASIAVLVGMEGISAMLHSLRLQWVEAQSKYAHFEGWPFQPLNLTSLVEESEELRDFVE